MGQQKTLQTRMKAVSVKLQASQASRIVVASNMVNYFFRKRLCQT